LQNTFIIWHGHCYLYLQNLTRNKEKKMKKILLAIGFTLFTLVISTNLMAFEYGRGRAHMMPERGRQQEGLYALYGKLNLSADQKAKIEALRNAHLRDIKPLQDQMFSKRGDLKLLWLQANPDKEKILAVQRDIRATRDKIEDKAVAHRVDVFTVLTPEQQEKARAFIGGHTPGAGMGEGWGQRGMGPGAGPGSGPGSGMMTGPCQGCN
jgi:Spy/CpxP family protein refolding chaperone